MKKVIAFALLLTTAFVLCMKIGFLIMLLLASSCASQTISYDVVPMDSKKANEYYPIVLNEGQKILPYINGMVIDRVSISTLQLGVPSTETIFLTGKEYLAAAIGYPVDDLDIRAVDVKGKVLAVDTAQDKAAAITFKPTPGQYLFLIDAPGISDMQGYYYFVLAHKE